MTTPKKPRDLRTLDQLEAEYHHLVNDRFLPTLTDYSVMAAEALALQVLIYTKRLKKLYKLREIPRVLTFNAKASMVSFEGLLQELIQKEIKVTEVIYDPARHDYHIFAKP